MTNKTPRIKNSEFDWLGYCTSCNVECCHNMDASILPNECTRPSIENILRIHQANEETPEEKYDKRPIRCQIYPFDVMEFDGRLEWVKKNHCHATPALNYQEQMDFFERQFSKKLTLDQIKQYVENDKINNPQKYVSNDFIKIREVKWPSQ